MTNEEIHLPAKKEKTIKRSLKGNTCAQKRICVKIHFAWCNPWSCVSMQSYAIRGLSNPLLILCSEHINGGNLKVGKKKEGGGGEVRLELKRKRFRRKTFLLSKTQNINSDEINNRGVIFMIIAYLWACSSLLSSHQSHIRPPLTETLPV